MPGIDLAVASAVSPPPDITRQVAFRNPGLAPLQYLLDVLWTDCGNALPKHLQHLHSRFRPFLILLSLLTASCSTTWPEYERPPLELPAPPAKPLSIDRQWWKSFEDPVLNVLVDEALLNNRDLAKAAANVAEAKAAVATAKSLLSPRVDGGVTAYSSQRQLELGSKEFEVLAETVKALNSALLMADARFNQLTARSQYYKAVVVAPVDGQVAVQYSSEGQYFGEQRPAAIHMFTNKKFIELRIPDQVYEYIKPKAFAEFYVDAYPGKIFRARVHSITESTGEAQGSLFGTPQSVGQFVNQNNDNMGRTLILEFEEPEGVQIPIGATGKAWVAGEKPIHLLGFLDLVIGSLLRFAATESYLKAM